MSATNKKYSKQKQRTKQQTKKVISKPQFSTQRENEITRLLTDPIVVPFLCKPAALRAMMFSLTGLRYKEYLSTKLYGYTAYRLEKMFNKLDQYPDSVIKAWVSSKPGFIIYSRKFIGLDNIKVWRRDMTPQLIQQQISQGNIIKVEEDHPLPEFEAYVHDGGFENEWIKSLPKFIENDHKSGEVLPIFRSDVRKYLLGSVRRTFGLPGWYVALENKVEGLQIDGPGQMGPGDIMFSEFRCIPISPIKGTDNYVQWNDKIRTLYRSKYCLVWDGCINGADMGLIQNFQKHGLYTINIEGFHRVEVSINGMKIYLKVKTRSLISDNRKQKIIYKGILGEEDDDFFFKLLFSSEDMSNYDSWSPVGLKTGDSYTIKYIGMSTGFDYTETLLVNESFNSIIANGKRRMYVIGRKGTMKTRFMRYVNTKLDSSSVKLIDSDSYGKWLLWMKAGASDKSFYDVDDLTVGTHLNYIEQLADMHFGQGRIGARHDKKKLEIFNNMYEELLKDPVFGIRQWQLFVEKDLMAETIIYFVHSDIEVRNMIAAHPTPILVTSYNPLRVLKSRDNGRTRQGQALLGIYYDRYIPQVVSHIEYKDILLMLGVDTTVDSY